MAVFTLDWSATNIDGNTTLSAFGDKLNVAVSTLANNNDSRFLANFGNRVLALAGQTIISVTFDEPVQNIAFELFFVDADAGWHDKITIIAIDADGNQVPVSLTDDHVFEGMETTGGADSVSVNIANSIVSLQIIYDNDAEPEDSRVAGLSAVTFATVEPDGYVGGSSGDDTIDSEDADGSDIELIDLSGTDVASIDYDPGNAESGTVAFLDGSTMTFSGIENAIPCFTTGTLIATPLGERPVEDLRIGDQVQTRDNGLQTIVWAGQKTLSRANLAVAPDLRPVRIKAGALGQGLPERDMLVSPNHRMLIVSERAQLYFEQSEVLIAARHLTGRPGVDVINVPGITYVHFMFANHEVVLADGAWSESFQPGDYTLRGVGDAQRQEIFALFPELETPQGVQDYRSARLSLKGYEAALLLQ